MGESWVENFNVFSIVLFAIGGGILSAVVAIVNASYISSIELPLEGKTLTIKLAKAIQDGASAFLVAEYKVLAVFVIAVFALLAIFLDAKDGPAYPATATCFLFGAILSASCGWMGMKIATLANIRTTLACAQDENGVADRVGAVDRG